MDDAQSSIETSRGEKLKALREKNEWSIEEVAASLNLRVEVIRSLESDDYSALPEQTYVRGYIRSYGRLLGLQEVDALNDLPETRRSKGALGSVIPIMGGSELKYAQEVPKTAVSNPAVRLWLRPVLLSIAAILLILDVAIRRLWIDKSNFNALFASAPQPTDSSLEAYRRIRKESKNQSKVHIDSEGSLEQGNESAAEIKSQNSIAHLLRQKKSKDQDE